MSNDVRLSEMEKLFLALGDKTRLRILNLLSKTTVNVNLFSEILGESQPKVSRHLAYLKSSGVVETERAGKMIYYKIALAENSFQMYILRDILHWLEDDPQMQAEHDKLKKHIKINERSEIIHNEKGLNTFAKTNMSSNREELAIFLL